MKKVLIVGATGMIGSLVLKHCLEHPKVGSIVSISRKASQLTHAKLQEYLHDDFLNYENFANQFEHCDMAFFCIGVYTGQVTDARFKEITVDYAVAFAEQLKRSNPKARLCFLSGAGADRTEKSRTSFAKYKGMAENFLASSGLEFYSFRPAYIYPVNPRKEPNLMYTISRLLYPVIKLFGKNASIRSTELATAMVKVGFEGAPGSFLENREILSIVQ